MGNSKYRIQQQQSVNLADIPAAIKYLGSDFEAIKNQQLENVYKYLRIINATIQKQHLITTNAESEIVVNQIGIELWYVEQFDQKLLHLYNHLINKVEELTKKNLLFIKLKQWKYLQQLCKFILVFTSKQYYHTMNNLQAFSKLQANTKKIIEKYIIKQQYIEERKSPLKENSRDEVERNYKALLILLTNFVKLSKSTLSRSQNTLEHIDKFADLCFILFCNNYFNQRYHTEIKRRAIKINNQVNLENASYFLGKSLQEKNPILFNTSGVFILSLIAEGKTNKQIQSLPAYLFKSAPTLGNNNLYDFVFVTVLYGLSFQKRQSKIVPKLNCNRYLCYRLLQTLLKHEFTVFSNLSAFYLENLIINCKVEELERIYLIDLCKIASKFKAHDIFTKFLSYEQVTYQLAFTNKKITLDPQSLKNTLADFSEDLFDQIDHLYAGYIETYILNITNTLKWDERKMWNKYIAKRKENTRMSVM